MQSTAGAYAVIPRAPEGSSERLRIHVVFTTPTETREALRHAERLSAGLDSEIVLILTPIVPFPLPLDQPPTSLAFAQEQIHDLAQFVDRELLGYIYFCRDPLRMLESALRPHSLLVMGLCKRWFFSRSERLARALRRRGHEVVVSRV